MFTKRRGRTGCDKNLLHTLGNISKIPRNLSFYPKLIPTERFSSRLHKNTGEACPLSKFRTSAQVKPASVVANDVGRAPLMTCPAGEWGGFFFWTKNCVLCTCSIGIKILAPSRESECSMTSPGHQIPGEVGSRDECQQLCTEEEVQSF